MGLRDLLDICASDVETTGDSGLGAEESGKCSAIPVRWRRHGGEALLPAKVATYRTNI